MSEQWAIRAESGVIGLSDPETARTAATAMGWTLGGSPVVAALYRATSSDEWTEWGTAPTSGAHESDGGGS